MHCNILQHTATQCNTLQHTATYFDTLQHTATHCNTLQYNAIASICNTLQRTTTAPIYNVLQQRPATYCNSAHSNNAHMLPLPQHCNTRTATHYTIRQDGMSLAYTATRLRLCSTHCNTLAPQHRYCTLQHIATHCNILYHTATQFNTSTMPGDTAPLLQHTATHCSKLQRIATHSDALQHINVA